LLPNDGPITGEPQFDAMERIDERVRNVVGRGLIYASPVVAAFCALSLRRLVESGTLPIISHDLIVLVNLGIAVISSAVGVSLLRGRLAVKIGGSLAYGVLSFIVYMCLFAIFVATRLWQP
jgi:hypothetical protein